MVDFVVGQRWLSDSETELGLGIVDAVDQRMIQVKFPAVDEVRLYARQQAPLTRLIYQEGDSVTLINGLQVVIEQVNEHNGLYFYLGKTSQDELHQFIEADLHHQVRLSKPTDRLFNGQFDSIAAFDVRYQSLLARDEQAHFPYFGLTGARASLIPHQLFIAKQVAERHAPRVLLADEVGLGKTIEAGLIIHQQLLTGRAARVLIIVPESLQHQWMVEMLRRFNLRFSLFDQSRIEQEEGDNPFDNEQLVLCHLGLLKSPETLQKMLAASWDLLVVDEAHHLQWRPNAPSVEYQQVESLTRAIAGVLLLTATPEQLGLESHFARLRLLDPDRYYDLALFKQQEQQYQMVAQAIQPLVEDQPLTEETLHVLSDWIGEDALRKRLAKMQDQSASVASREQARQQLIQFLIDHHGTGRVLFRNTRATIHGFPGRELLTYPLTVPNAYTDLELHQLDAMLHPEISYSKQLSQGEKRWIYIDPRVEWLLGFLKQHKKEKVLLICAHASTVLDLEEAIFHQTGTKPAVFHEGMSIVARDKAAAYFADMENGPSILLCSEIGSEGRNFQFSHHLVLFDLPFNPDLLEQRIGRLDRIGQHKTVQLHVPYFVEHAQERLYMWLHGGLNAFCQTSHTAAAVFAKQQSVLQTVLLTGNGLSALLAETQQLHQQLLNQMQQGRDRLLELNSCGRLHGIDLSKAITEYQQNTWVEDYMEDVWDVYALDVETHSEQCLLVRASEQMLVPHFPTVSVDTEEAQLITFDRATAVAREDVQYITWEHPMVQGAIDMVLSAEFGNSAIAILDSPEFESDQVLVEAVFSIEVIAPKAYQLDRYLPATTIRVLMDKNKDNLAQEWPNQAFSSLLQPMDRVQAQLIIKEQEKYIQKRIRSAVKGANYYLPSIIKDACQKLIDHLTTEIKRTVALQKVNSSVREEEVEFLKQQLLQGHKCLQSAELKLDAIRVVFSIRD